MARCGCHCTPTRLVGASALLGAVMVIIAAVSGYGRTYVRYYVDDRVGGNGNGNHHPDASGGGSFSLRGAPSNAPLTFPSNPVESGSEDPYASLQQIVGDGEGDDDGDDDDDDGATSPSPTNKWTAWLQDAADVMAEWWFGANEDKDTPPNPTSDDANDADSVDAMMMAGTPRFDNGNDNDRSAFYSSLPRTTTRTYNFVSPGAVNGYLAYSPSGGWSNQLVELTTGLLLARLTNRTLVVPMAAEHTSGWASYDRLRLHQLFPMDRLLDMAFMECFFAKSVASAANAAAVQCDQAPAPTPRLLPLSNPIEQWRDDVARNRTSSRWLHVMELSHTHDREATKRWIRGNKDRVLFVHGAGFFGADWFGLPQYLEAKRYLRPAPALRALAMRVVQTTFGGARRFNAVHVRLGDYLRAGRSPEASWWVKQMESRHFPRSLPLYVSTDMFSRKLRAKFFMPFVAAGYNVTFKDNLLPRDAFLHYASLFSREARNDFVGLLEQLVCAQAFRFQRSPYSTFSAYVDFMRHHMADSFPEVGPASAFSSASAASGDVSDSESVGENNNDDDDDEDVTGSEDELNAALEAAAEELGLDDDGDR